MSLAYAAQWILIYAKERLESAFILSGKLRILLI